MKHLHPIVLEEWQRFVVEDHPKEFIRGLIHSDGCRVTNWTTRIVAGEKKRYEYPHYHFTNESTDIMNLFTATLDTLGIEWRMNKRDCVSIARRDSVAYLDEFVGPKYWHRPPTPKCFRPTCGSARSKVPTNHPTPRPSSERAC